MPKKANVKKLHMICKKKMLTMLFDYFFTMIYDQNETLKFVWNAIYSVQTNKLRPQCCLSTHTDSIALLLPTQSPVEFQWSSLHDSTRSAVCRIRVWLGYLAVMDELQAYHLAMKFRKKKLTNCNSYICAVLTSGCWIQAGYLQKISKWLCFELATLFTLGFQEMSMKRGCSCNAFIFHGGNT